MAATTLRKRRRGPDDTARERLVAAAYDLFSVRGVNQTGVDTVLAESGCAKASLYRHFPSKVDLALAFLEEREKFWTRGWLEAEISRRSDSPEGQLLAVFDVFDVWFRRKDFEGCSFINVLLESEQESPVRQAAAIHLERIRGIIGALADEAGLARQKQFAHAWHMLMKGAIVTAGEGHRDAARDAKGAAELLLESWPRR
jgi:AcrR family transcriptional regulator